MNHSLSSFADDFSPAFEAGDSEHRNKSVEAANVACVQTFYRAVAQGAYAEVRACLALDVSFQLLGMHALPSPGTTGIESVMEQLQANFEAIESEEAVIETLAAQGDTIMAVARNRGHIKANGAPYQLLLIMHYIFRDGLIWRFRQWVFPLGEDSPAA